MYPINNIQGIYNQESELEGNHVIILFLVKPSDTGADDYIKKFNYLHYRSKRYCSIYLLGYSQDFQGKYIDAISVQGIDHQEWQYSDQCFSDACDELQNRLSNWHYSGEPEMIILQNSSNSDSKECLNFTNYNYIDINYGIEKQYIDSFPRFMERLIQSCKKEVTAVEAITSANRKRISPRKVMEYAIEECPRLPRPVRSILKDKLFYKSCRNKAA